MMHVHIRIDDRFEFLGIAELNLENGCILFEIKDESRNFHLGYAERRQFLGRKRFEHAAQ